jgi:hypothetical protein
MTVTAAAYESLNRAVTGESTMNYEAIFSGFAAMGIPEDQIQPRVNVLTFWGWKALNRHVCKGVHGVKAVTFVQASKKAADGTQSSFRMSRTVTVFHVSQTEPDTPGATRAAAPAHSAGQVAQHEAWPLTHSVLTPEQIAAQPAPVPAPPAAPYLNPARLLTAPEIIAPEPVAPPVAVTAPPPAPRPVTIDAPPVMRPVWPPAARPVTPQIPRPVYRQQPATTTPAFEF